METQQNRLRQYGGQYAPAIGDSTLHHKHPFDFSVALANASGQHASLQGTSTRDDEQLALFWFNQELRQYAGQADVAW